MDSPPNKAKSPSSADILSGRMGEVEYNFKNAQAVISRRLLLLEKQQELLQLSKEKALGDVDSCFDQIIHVIQIRKKLLKGEVKSQFEEISERLEKASETLTLSAMCLDTLKTQYNEEVELRQSSKEATKGLLSFSEMANKEIRRQEDIAAKLEVDVGHIDLEKEQEKVDDIVKLIKTTGKLKVEEGLPAHVKLLGVKARVPLTSKALMAITDYNEQPIKKELFDSGLVSLQLMDEAGESDIPVQVHTICENGNVSATFKPQMAGRHVLSVQVYGSTLESFDMEVQKCQSECAIGKKEKFVDANGVTTDKEGNVFVVDSGTGFLYKYTSSGKLQWTHNFLEENGCVCFDVTCAKDTGLLICTVQKPGVLSEEESGAAGGGDSDAMKSMQKSLEDPLGAMSSSVSAAIASTSSDSTLDMPPVSADSLALSVFQFEVRNTSVLCIEKQAYVSLTRNGQILLSDPIHNLIMIYNHKGAHMHTFTGLDLDCPAFSCGSPLEQILVCDVGNNLVRIAGYYDNDASGHVTAWTNGEAWIEPGQLALPVGMAADRDGNVLVTDSGTGCIHVYGHGGESSAVIDPVLVGGGGGGSGVPPAEQEFSPWAVTPGARGYLWVVDKATQTVHKLKYLD